jgi:hypothetical protein
LRVQGQPVIVVGRIHHPAEGQLFGVVDALDALGAGFSAAQSRQQHGGQDGDNRDHYQQLDQRECRAMPGKTFPPAAHSKNPTAAS